MDKEKKTFYCGVALTLLSAFCYSLNSNFAAISYAEGAEPLPVLTTRIVVGSIGLYLLLKIKKVSLALSLRDVLAATGLGIFLSVGSFCLLSSFQYIPVALAILIFYLFPLMTAIGAWIMDREPLTPIFVMALGFPLVGLALALNIGGNNFDIKGVGLAIAAALAITFLMLFNSKLVKGKDPRSITLIILSSNAVIFVVVDLVVGRFLLPMTSVGMVAFFGVAVAYSFAIIIMFFANAMIGPVRTSLFLNFEPVSTIILGFFVLGQVLTPLQLLGAAIVIAAITLAGRQKMAMMARE